MCCSVGSLHKITRGHSTLQKEKMGVLLTTPAAANNAHTHTHIIGSKHGTRGRWEDCAPAKRLAPRHQTTRAQSRPAHRLPRLVGGRARSRRATAAIRPRQRRLCANSQARGSTHAAGITVASPTHRVSTHRLARQGPSTWRLPSHKCSTGVTIRPALDYSRSPPPQPPLSLFVFFSLMARRATCSPAPQPSLKNADLTVCRQPRRTVQLHRPEE